MPDMKNALRYAIEHTATKRRKVVAMMALSEIACQRKLSGIFSVFDENPDWNIKIYRSQGKAETTAFLRDLKGDVAGVIYSCPYDQTLFRDLAGFEGPVVVMDNAPHCLSARTANTIFIRNSPNAIAEASFRYFKDIGYFASAAFVNMRTDFYWSKARSDAFVETFGIEHSRVYTSFGKTAAADRRSLARFLASLPKPALVQAANDDRATEIVEAAAAAGIDIPGAISVLGVDNEPYVCTGTMPAISSIEPDHFEEGRRAAIVLDAMMRKKTPSPNDQFHVGVRQVVLRRSTLNVIASKGIVDRVKAIIADTPIHDLTPGNIAGALGVSRSLLDLRIRQAKLPSLQKQITALKMKSVLRLVRETHTPFSAIPAACGFPNGNSLKNAFKRQFGMSMRECRALNETTK